MMWEKVKPIYGFWVPESAWPKGPEWNHFTLYAMEEQMGCDIHAYAERKISGGRWEFVDCPFFTWRDYGLYGFLANVRNYSKVPPISEAMGFPRDTSPEVAKEYDSWRTDAHSPSWLSVRKLLDFNYDASFEDRRVTRPISKNLWDGACTAEPGEGELTTFRKFLGKGFFEDLKTLRVFGATRIVFWFDN